MNEIEGLHESVNVSNNIASSPGKFQWEHNKQEGVVMILAMQQHGDSMFPRHEQFAIFRSYSEAPPNKYVQLEPNPRKPVNHPVLCYL